MIEIRVDRDRCQGHARCWSLDQELFTIDDDGYSTLERAVVGDDRADLAHQAMQACPEGAIEVVEAPAED